MIKNRQKILELVSSYPCWISAKDICRELSSINKTTVYRNLLKLVSSWDIIEDLSFNSKEKIYSIKTNHHHHFICDKCNKSIDLWCLLDKQIKEFEDKNSIKINNHSLLFRWICKNCK